MGISCSSHPDAMATRLLVVRPSDLFLLYIEWPGASNAKCEQREAPVSTQQSTLGLWEQELYLCVKVLLTSSLSYGLWLASAWSKHGSYSHTYPTYIPHSSILSTEYCTNCTNCMGRKISKLATFAHPKEQSTLLLPAGNLHFSSPK